MADYDLAIIGGGINGAAIARDAAGRGVRVVLFEQSDLASGTSSASTKLIHGGLRYLEHGALRMVRGALAEREVLLKNAPHIIRPMRFVLPLDPEMRFEGGTPVSTAETFATRTRPERRRKAPAREGWRGALNEAFGWHLAPSADELHARELITTVQRGLPGHRTAVVVNIKGGASKTTATYLLSATLGRVRGGTVLAWDNNENAGNLADRAMPASHHHTALDLLANIDQFRTPEHVDKLTGYVRAQGDNRFHVLASQDHAGDREVIDADAFRQMHAVLRQHYNLAIVDTGNASTAAT